MTPLAEKLAARIRANGPITVADFMTACLGDPEYGYYIHREAFGRGGDFVTAPEISQMFGELIGVWTVAAWEAMGSPAPFVLAELGPGRGTLIIDLLRAARSRPAFGAAARLHLVETSPRLRAVQAATLADAGIMPVWHDGIDTLPDGPVIAIANEFFDALPVRQFVRAHTGWAERMVGLDTEGQLTFGLRAAAVPDDQFPAAGAVYENSPAATAIMEALAGRLARQGGAALIIDYGYERPGAGDTLQAVRKHAYDDPLAHPGEADLTAHVDFGALAAAALTDGAEPRRLMTQGAFLLRLGILERAGRLGAGKPPDVQATIRSAVERLCDPRAMGKLFKVLAVSSPGLALAAFDRDDPAEGQEGHRC